MIVAAIAKYELSYNLSTTPVNLDDTGLFDGGEINKNTSYAHISVSGGTLRYTVAGTEVPSATTHMIAENSERIFEGLVNIKNLKIAAESGTVDIFITLYEA